jgi:hypothetical protein
MPSQWLTAAGTFARAEHNWGPHASQTLQQLACRRQKTVADSKMRETVRASEGEGKCQESYRFLTVGMWDSAAGHQPWTVDHHPCITAHSHQLLTAMRKMTIAIDCSCRTRSAIPLSTERSAHPAFLTTLGTCKGVATGSGVVSVVHMQSWAC